jgi:hypothetical protein
MRLSACAVMLGILPGLLFAQEPAVAGPKRGGFRLFSGAALDFRVNQVSCGVYNLGSICLSPPQFDGLGGAFWPKGTGNYYFYNSGPQVAGVIGPDGGPWANDTSGAFFFDAKGTTVHGEGVTNIFSAADSNDVRAWPAAAFVPTGPEGTLYHPSLHSRVSASEGDAWWLMWDGNPGLLAGRAHPLGILVEARVLAWNYPAGNDDIIYLAQTFYNITSLNSADYASVRPELRTILLQQAARFHQNVTEKLGVTLPAGGYTIDPFYAAITADPDVANAGVNFSSVHVPFSLSFTWDPTFSAYQYWTFDPRLYSNPFFAGSGFGGIAFLTSPSGEGALRVFSTSTNGGPDFPTARDVSQLFRFISGQPDPQLDGACNFNPATQKICAIRTTSGSDIRTLQATGPMSLPPGGFETRMAAYVFAAPVRTGGSATCPSCNINPGAANVLAGLPDPAIVAAGVNPIDSIAGFLGASDLSGDGVLQRDEFLSVPRSLYGKAQLAQALFDHQFLLPSAPAAPDFFLIPGEAAVTVMWRPSATEQTGDAFFAVAKDAQLPNTQGVLVPNPLYDPNFRQFDVEGYRIYRGRVDDPGAMSLLVQFDYAGTVISDYAGQVNPNRFCAPELGVTTQCPIAYDPVVPGQARVAHVDVHLVGPVEQLRFGDRVPLMDGSVIHARTDSVSRTGTELIDAGVPFTFVDNTVRNNFRYFYTVTAFDVNSWQSGPSSFESPRVTKSVTPARRASNYANSAQLTSRVYGRGVSLVDSIQPPLDPATGIFSRPFPPTRSWTLTLDNVVPEVLGAPGARFSLFVDSLALGDPYGSSGTCFGGITTPVTYFIRIATPTDTTGLTLPILQDCTSTTQSFTTAFDALPADPDIAARFGSTGSFNFRGTFAADVAGNYYTNAFGRGCVNGAPGFNFFNSSRATGCDYNGARWFNGPSPANNETAAHPNACSAQNNTSQTVTCFANAGSLTGVANIYEAKSYQTTVNVWRNIEGVLGGAVRGADYNVYWGAGGSVDSVVDVTDNLIVPFSTGVGASWGFLNQAAAQPSGFGQGYDARAELTLSDFGCVEPFRSLAGPQLQIPCAGTSPGDGPLYQLSSSAVPGPMAFFTGPIIDNQSHPVAPNPGIAMAMPGHIFLFELTGGQLPPSGTVWSLRDYVGAIIGGGNGCSLCQAGNDGPYLFNNNLFSTRPRPLGVGAEIRFTVDVVNQVNAPTGSDLTRVHTVPDPYYLASEFEADAAGQVIKFVNLPQDAVIRVYSSSGVLVSLLEHHSTTFGGAMDWNVKNRTGRRVSSGVYFYHIEAGNARRVGRFTIVNDRPGF